MEIKEIARLIKDSVDISEVIGSYVRLQKSGKNFKANCPFHQEKTPSFYVFPQTQTFHCFGCGETGDVISFISKINGLSFTESIQLLSEKSGVEIPSGFGVQDKEFTDYCEFMKNISSFFHSQLLKNQAALNYVCNTRKIPVEIVKELRIGFSPDPFFSNQLVEKAGKDRLFKFGITNADGTNRYSKRIIIPIEDRNNRVVGLSGRVLQDENGVAKYINSTQNRFFNKGRILFLEGRAKKHILEAGFVIITEGYMDAISLFSKGIKNVVAVMGTSMNDGHFKILSSYIKRILLLLDSDQAGVKAVGKIFELVPEGFSVMVGSFSGAKDPDEFLRKNGVEEFHKELLKALPIEEFILNQLKKNFDLNNPSGKSSFLNDLLPLLDKLANKNDIPKFENVFSKSAKALSIEGSELKSWWEKKRSNSKKKDEVPSNKVKHSVDKFSTPEDWLLYLFLFFPHFRKRIEVIFQKYSSFVNENFRAFFEDAGKKFNIENSGAFLNEYFKVEELNRVGKIQQNSFEISTFEKTLTDCEQRLKERKIEKRISEIDLLLEKSEEQEIKGLLIKERMNLIQHQEEIC